LARIFAIPPLGNRIPPLVEKFEKQVVDLEAALNELWGKSTAKNMAGQRREASAGPIWSCALAVVPRGYWLA
jgi:hypothetical protein